MNATNYCKTNHILVGLGGTGGKILRAFKMRMFEEIPNPEERAKLPVAILYVDSTREMMSSDGKGRTDFRVLGQDASFQENEFLFIKDVDVTYILDHIDSYPSVARIVDNVEEVRTAIGALGEAAGQKRRAGRLLFAANATSYVNALTDAHGRCQKLSGNVHTTIHIFAGLSGGTGSGSIIDAIVQTRKNFPDAKILVYAMIPEKTLPKSDMDQGRYYQNGYAALVELNALQSGRWCPQDVTGKGTAKLFNETRKGVANGLTIYSNVNENGLVSDSFTEMPRLVSDYVYARVFLINSDEANSDILRAYSYENIDDFAVEYDELYEGLPRVIARTKKINSFGVKRIIYPETRILNHITYTVGESILYQFRYNNWRENQGFANEERNKDYGAEWLKTDKISAWKIDLPHLTLDEKILPTDAEQETFHRFWEKKINQQAENCLRNNNPFNEISRVANEIFDKHFRGAGVVEFFKGKEAAIKDMTKEIRHLIESELYTGLRNGQLSIVELTRVSELICAFVSKQQNIIEEKINKEKVILKGDEEKREKELNAYNHMIALTRAINKNAYYRRHLDSTIRIQESRTVIKGLEFAKKLATALRMELANMDKDIAEFSRIINDSIDETERLIAAHQKKNKGLEDIKSAVIEVSEEEATADFEREIKVDDNGMTNITTSFRETILPDPKEFINFARLNQTVNTDIIRNAFDFQLSVIIKNRHSEKAESDTKVLGMNILTQLQQKLPTQDAINKFAKDIVEQSGAYLKLNKSQIYRQVPNNEDQNPQLKPASGNKKVMLISMPSPEDNAGLKKFADNLEQALKASVPQGERISISVNRTSPRKDELSIVTVSFCYPMRAIEWAAPYQEKYDNFLHSGYEASDRSNAILLHSEGMGDQYPSLFVLEGEEAERKKSEIRAKENAAAPQNQQTAQTPPAQTPPPATEMPPMPSPQAMPPAMPELKLYISAGGRQYGPFNLELCRQMKGTGQLTADSMVWKEGMAAWARASEVAELATLFAPAMPPANPEMPPMPAGMPPL